MSPVGSEHAPESATKPQMSNVGVAESGADKLTLLKRMLAALTAEERAALLATPRGTK